MVTRTVTFCDRCRQINEDDTPVYPVQVLTPWRSDSPAHIDLCAEDAVNLLSTVLAKFPDAAKFALDYLNQNK